MSTPSSPQRVRACGSTVFLSPEPVRMVHLIGGFTFGSLPQIFYQHLAERLCREKRYSVVLHPFRFTPFLPDHWALALGLYERLRLLQLRDLPLLSARDPFYLFRSNHVWLGHSLGCKLIELLELLSLPFDQRHAALLSILRPEEVQRIEQLIGGTVQRLQTVAQGLGDSSEAQDLFAVEWQRQLTRRQQAVEPQFILDQASVLMAPQLSGAQRLPGTGLRLVDSRVQPSWEQTCYLVRSQQSIFHLTDVIRFEEDQIAADDIHFLEQVLQARQGRRDRAVVREVPGGHLRPLCPTTALVEAIDASIRSQALPAPPLDGGSSPTEAPAGAPAQAP